MSGIPDGAVGMVLCDLSYEVTTNKKDKQIDLAPLWEHYDRVAKQWHDGRGMRSQRASPHWH